MLKEEQQLNSYIKLFRKAKKNSLFRKPLTFHYFTYCLLSAWWSDEPTKFDLGGTEVLIRKGEFATTLKRSAYETGLSIQNVRTAIKVLKLTGVLTEVLTAGLTNGGRILKVCKYSVYQAKKIEGNKPTNKPSNRPTNKQIKKVFNKEGIKKKPPYIPPRGKREHRSKISNAANFRLLIKDYLKIDLNDKSYDERINEKYKRNRTASEAKEELERETGNEGRTSVGSSEVKDSQTFQNADNRNPRRQRRVQDKQ